MINPSHFLHPARNALTPLARAVAVAAGLAIGGVQALTTSQTFNFGVSPAATTLASSAGGLLPWIPKGSLPPGSILRSVSVDAKIEDAGTDGATDDWASQLSVYFDPSPDAPATAALLQVGGYGAIGTVSLALTDTSSSGWANGQSEPPATVIDTKSEAAWASIGVVDLNTVSVSLGNDYSEASWSGTITIVYDIPQAAAIKTFGPGGVVSPLVGNAGMISWLVPSAADITALAPTFALSSGTADRDNGGPTTYDFTNPVVYTITDGETVNTYTVTATKATAVVWDLATGGDWDLETDNWRDLVSGVFAVFANGNEAIFENTAGGTINIEPGMSPLSTAVTAGGGTYTFSGSPLATGSLTKSGGGRLRLDVTPANLSSIAVDGGTLVLYAAETGFAPNGASFTIPDVTVGSGAFLEGYRTHATGGTLTLNGGTYFEYNGWSGSWAGPVILAADSSIGRDGTCYNQTISGEISGPGGLLKKGNMTLTLTAGNSYTGPTVITGGTLNCNHVDALGGGALSIGIGTKVGLNFAGTKPVASVSLGGVEQTSTGTYGSLTSDAIFKSGYFTGNGMVQTGDPESAAYITEFGTNVSGSAAIIGVVAANVATITWFVQNGTDLASLAPSFVVTPGSTCSNQTSGALPTPGFDAGPVTYTVVSENTQVTNVYTVSVTVLPLESTLIWNLASGGDWNGSATNWRGETSGLPMPFLDGLNVVFNNTSGGTINLDGDLSPLSTTVNAASGNYVFGVAAGGGEIITGSLVKDGGGTLRMAKANSYDGGTTIKSGTLRLEWPGDGVSHTTLGTGPVTLDGGTLFLFRVNMANPLTINGGSLVVDNGFGNTWSGPITLNVDTTINGMFGLTCSNAISGSGGLTKTSGGTLILSGVNTYSGPTSVEGGTLRFDSPESVTSGALGISGGAKVNLNFSGTKTIASLTLGGELKTAFGTYGSVASGAQFAADTYFTGTGTVTLGDVVSDYDAWLAGFTFAEGADTSPTGDPDGDGMTNFEEYAFGLDPTLGSSNNPIVQPLDPATGNFQYTRRATPAATGLFYTVLTSPDLDEWNTGGATETGVTTADGIETVTVNVTAAPVDGKLFVRVRSQPSQ